MRTHRRLVGLGISTATALAFACGSSDSGAPVVDAGTADATASAPDTSPLADAGDPRCATQAVALPDHPGAVTQDSGMGKNLRNVKAWNGELYFGYGDLNANTGPIDVESLNPATKTWTHRITVVTQSIERFTQIGNELWATCADAAGQGVAGCEYASGDANHLWSIHDIGVRTLHVMDVTERVPGEVLLAGSSLLSPTTTGAFVWRSLGGSPFQQIFPDVDAGDFELGGGPFMNMGTLNSVSYAVVDDSVWAWDGTEWSHARTPGDDVDPALLSDFVHPVTFAGHIVFGTFGGYLWKFDGKKTESLGIRTLDTPTAMGFTEAPVIIFEASEDHLLTVNESGDVLMSTDLVSWSCIGKAPADVRSLGSMDGTVYFGGANGHAYAYPSRSW